jgi:hypothetical protein
MNRASRIVILLCLWLVPASWAQLENSIPAPTRTVSGTRIGHYKDGPVPIDLSTRTIAALVPNGVGSYWTFSGTGTAAGTFSIPNVPYGYYLLQLGGRYIWTKNTVVNADYDLAYRSSAVTADPATTLTFNLRNLNPWQTNDVLELVDTSAGAFELFPGGTEGETTFAGTFPYSSNLNDSTQGDKTYLLQESTQYAGGYRILVASSYFSPSNFTQVDAVDTQLTGKLRTIQPNQSFRFNVNGADLAAATLAANPGATIANTVFALDVFPGNMARGWIVSTPDLVSYDLNSDAPPFTANADLGDVLYGNPFPKTFTLFALYQYSAQTSYLAPGASSPAAITTFVYGSTVTLPTSTRPLRLMVGTVVQPAVGRADFVANQSGMGLMPTLSWKPPKVGIAHAYQVLVYQVTNTDGITAATTIARLQTQGTSITIPPNVLIAGQAYVFQITTIYRPGVNVAANPYRLGPVVATADVISGLMQP